mmetsp:Transcript_12748/g.31121  ORF Transcript_12748/g.31121 Transcript_12748/m.31121 type:complete len:113 (-) Transcript_12748:903-1241(-)
MGDNAFCSPDKYIKINVVDIDVFVTATLMPAAKDKHVTVGGNDGNTYRNALPKADPAAKKGKMNPPRYPPATEKEIVTSLAKPTKRHLVQESISKPISPVVGKTCSRVLAGS